MNVSPLLPWDLTPALTQARLVTLARVAVATRNRAFSEADRQAGDTNWGLSCKAHERLMFALSRLSGEHPWLTVIRDGLYVMPFIEDVPVRLYRGDPERPTSRHLDAVRLEYERSQPARPQMAFGFMDIPTESGPWYWLMAMETDAAGMVSRVVFLQANDTGETRHPWECPLEARGEDAPAALSPSACVELSRDRLDTLSSLSGEAPAASNDLSSERPSASEERAKPRGRGARGAPKGAKPAADLRQKELWSMALGGE